MARPAADLDTTGRTPAATDPTADPTAGTTTVVTGHGPLHRVRLRVFAVVLGVGLGAFGLISLAAWPVLPVVGGAVVAVAFAVNAITTPLAQPICWGCGASLDGQTPGCYGVACPSCGTLNQGVDVLGDPKARRLAAMQARKLPAPNQTPTRNA